MKAEEEEEQVGGRSFLASGASPEVREYCTDDYHCDLPALTLCGACLSPVPVLLTHTKIQATTVPMSFIMKILSQLT